MVDLRLMNTVTVDPAARRARVGGGALLADLDAATQAHGLAVPAGLVSHTGVGGLTLGGGMGWLTRKFGLSIDNLVSAEVVTADARVLRVAADEHPDLFWAIRGGGGNFGVVTSFEFELHEVDPMVQFGMFFWPVDQGPEVLRLAAEITAAMPGEINAVLAAVNAPPGAVRPAAASPRARLRPAAHRVRDHARARSAHRPDRPGPSALLRAGHAPALPRPAEAAGRSQRLGLALLREGHLPPGAVRSGDRGDQRVGAGRTHPSRRCWSTGSTARSARSVTTRRHSAAGARPGTAPLSRALRLTPTRWPSSAAGSAASGRRCARTPWAAAQATSTAWPSTPATGSAEATAPPRTNGWPGSRPSTTRTTCSTSTPTSRRPHTGKRNPRRAELGPSWAARQLGVAGDRAPNRAVRAGWLT